MCVYGKRNLRTNFFRCVQPYSEINFYCRGRYMNREEIISKLTLRQKADLLTGKDFWSTQGYEELGIPSVFFSDGPHGLRKQAAASDHLGLNASVPATCFPTAVSMASSWNTELAEQMGEALGEEAASQNVNMLLGPGLCIKRNPRCGRNFEYFSEDPYLAGKMAAAYVRGIQKNGTAACIKHYAANSQEERRMVTDSVMDERTLREIYLTNFEIAVTEGKPYAVMSSYNMVNGAFADENTHLLREILRGAWGFDGVVVSDWAGTNNKVASTVAGSDIEMPGCRYGADDVVEAVESGKLDIKYVDECVDRVLQLIEKTTAGEKGKEFDKEAHHELAKRCADECVVLLKNEGNILPIAKSTSVALVGDFARKPRYQGAGSSIVNPTTLECVVDDKREYPFNVIGFADGFERYGKRKKSLITNAVELAKKADVTVFFAGLDEYTEAEGLDRQSLEVPANQIETYRALKDAGLKVVVVLSCGSAVYMDWASDADAIVYAGLTGQASATAVLDILSGTVNPSAKLAETWSLRETPCASESYFPGKEMTCEYREGLYVGYRYFDKTDKNVEYPFGFGLSYTTFEYSDIAADDSGVTFKITNTGNVDGAEVAQLYVGKPDGKIFRPAKELKGFKKVFLKKGESATVTIPFDDKTFRYFDVESNGWEVEGGEYALYIGASSRDIRLQATVTRKGTKETCPYDKSKLASYYSGKVDAVENDEFRALLGRDIPKSGYDFYKHNRMIITENATVADLRYSRRWVGRLFSGAIRFAIKFLYAVGNRGMANTLVMGVLHQPVRGLAKFGGMSRRQMKALMMMFNGQLCRGVVKFLTKDKKAGQSKKEEKA